ncbi:hypothetical protein H072_6461 [Dactylellina haptotyla CBS 200.50]|uniref:F-box domain-containing protein n=1 Tax=Dactylellina haptotyla (strain CBS 200.50) TaxID=1284197 RepID=S8A9P3_DACHA|nr:hypothetical protein H072_6461 [Dactylellina haptotyla CBS 200.50]
MSTATSFMPTELDPSHFKFYDDELDRPRGNIAENLERFFDGEAPRIFTEPASPADIGSLKCLPTELLEEIIYNLDIRSLENFRQANKHTLVLVESLPKYKTVFQYARIALRGILSIQTGAYIQFSDLYDEICCESCERCGLFGDYIYLLTFKRVCYFCIVDGDTYRPIELQSAKIKYGLTDEILRSVASMKVLPKADPQGTDVDTIAMIPRKTLVDRVSALRAAVLLHGSHDERGARAQYKRNPATAG